MILNVVLNFLGYIMNIIVGIGYYFCWSLYGNLFEDEFKLKV